MTILLIVLLILILVILIVLSLPVRFHLLLSHLGNQWELRVLSWQVASRKDTREKSKAERLKKSKKQVEATGTESQEKVKKQKKESTFPWFSFLVSERQTILSVLQWFFRAIGRLLRLPTWETIRLRWQIGGDDPAVIGYLNGLCWSVSPFVPNRLHFEFESDFVNGVWEWEAECSVNIVPLLVVWWLVKEVVCLPWVRIGRFVWHKYHFQATNFA